jgi:hypothetical protein
MVIQEVIYMANLTLAIPNELREKMRRFPEINWSEVARQAIVEKAKILEQMQRLLSRSQLTDKETISIGRQIKRHVWRRHQRVS